VASGPAIDGMGSGAGAAAGGAAGGAEVDVSGVVGEVCATLVAVAPNIEAIRAAASTRLSGEGLFMIKLGFLPCAGSAVNLERAREVIAKLLRLEGSVQLIVFFAVIREILKREIYGGDKKRFCAMKTKGQFGTRDGVRRESRIRPIRFVNAEGGADRHKLRQPVRFPTDGRF